MKSLLFVLCLVLLGCSKENPVEPAPIVQPTSLSGFWKMTVISDTETIQYDLTIQEFPTWIQVTVFHTDYGTIQFGGHIYDHIVATNAGIDPNYHSLAGKYDDSFSFISGTWTSWFHPSLGTWIETKRQFSAIRNTNINQPSALAQIHRLL